MSFRSGKFKPGAFQVTSFFPILVWIPQILWRDVTGQSWASVGCMWWTICVVTRKMKSNCRIRRSQLPAHLGRLSWWAPRSQLHVLTHPKHVGRPGAAWHVSHTLSTPLNNSAPTIRLHSRAFLEAWDNVFHIENQICCLLIGRLWQTLPGEMPEEGARSEGRLQCGACSLSSVQRGKQLSVQIFHR